MTDVMLSYASADRERAQAALTELRELGLSVWIDDARDMNAKLDSIGIPAGRAHWDTIRKAIDEADAVLIIDGERWRESEYCLREMRYALDRGKWVAALSGHDEREWNVPLTDRFERIAEFAEVRAEHEPVLEAHSRLIALADDDRRKSRMTLREWFASRSVAGDIEKVVSPDTPVRLTPELERFIEDFEGARSETSGRARRYGRRLAGGLSVAAILAIVAFVLARHEEQRASGFRDVAKSLDLADQSFRATDTAGALDAAAAGVNLDENRFTLEAERVADAASRRIRKVAIPKLTGRDRYWDVQWDADGHVVWFTSASQIFRADLRNDEVSASDPMDELIEQGTLVVSPDGAQALLSSLDGNTYLADDRGRLAEVRGVGADARFTLGHEALWVIDRGVLSKVRDPWRTDWGQPQKVADVGTDAYDLTFDPRGRRVVILGRDGTILEVPVRGGSAGRKISDVPLLGEQVTTSPRSPFQGQIVVCGRNAYGAVQTSERGNVRLTYRLGSGRPAGARMKPLLALTRLSCWNRVAVARSWIGSGVAIPDRISAPDKWLPSREGSPMAVSPDEKFVAVPRPSGQLEVADLELVPWAPTVEDAVKVMPVAGGLVTLDAKGQLRLTRSYSRNERRIGSIGDFNTAGIAVRKDGQSWLVTNAGRVFLVSAGAVVPVTRAGWAGKQATMGGEDLLMARRGRIQSIRADGRIRQARLRGLDFKAGEDIAALAGGGGSAVIITTFGNLVKVALDGHIEAKAELSLPGGRVAAVETAPGGRVLVGVPDGRLLLLDRDLKVIRQELIGSPAISIRVTGERAVIGQRNGDVVVVDIESLRTLEVPVRGDALSSMDLTPDGAAILSSTLVYDPPSDSAGSATQSFPLRLSVTPMLQP